MYFNNFSSSGRDWSHLTNLDGVEHNVESITGSDKPSKVRICFQELGIAGGRSVSTIKFDKNPRSSKIFNVQSDRSSTTRN